MGDELSADTLGSRIRRARRAKGLTLEQLASQLGVSKVSVWNWEADRSRPRVILLDPLSAILGVSADTLMRGGDSESAVADLIADCQSRIGDAVGVQPENVEIKITFGGGKA